jgi:glycosyltransferase involved in cell wall biosynthesis
MHCVDTHIHSWHEHYAQGFDVCTVSLKDHLPRFRGAELEDNQLAWLPPFAKDEDLPPDTMPEKQWDVLFVGHVDEALSPGRFAFFNELKGLLPQLEVRTGNYRELYPLAKIVLNEAERGDLNFRVFEALGCSSCLVTPEVGHGLLEMFTPDRELAVYPRGDAKACARICLELLNNPEACQAMGQAGYARINALHRSRHRADAFVDLLDMVPEDRIRTRLSRAKMIRDRYLKRVYLHWAEVCANVDIKHAYLAAAKGNSPVCDSTLRSV